MKTGEERPLIVRYPMTGERLETGKNWLQRQAEEMGADRAGWDDPGPDVDQKRHSLTVWVRGHFVVCSFPDFRLSKVPEDRDVARGLRNQVKSCLARLHPEQARTKELRAPVKRFVR